MTLTHVTEAPKGMRTWERIASPSAVVVADARAVEGAASLPGAYSRVGQDHELPEWSVLFCGEEHTHRRKPTVWHHFVGFVCPGAPKVVWIRVHVIAHKRLLKREDGAHLLGGSGPNAAALSIAQWILAAPTEDGRLARIKAARDPGDTD